jgi:hypothetical protein
MAKRKSESLAGTERLMEEVCELENCKQALERVKANKGSPGIDIDCAQAEDACVTDEDVETSKCRNRLLHCFLQVLSGGTISFESNGLASTGLYFADQFLGFGLGSCVGEGDRCSLRRKPTNDTGSDTARSARHSATFPANRFFVIFSMNPTSKPMWLGMSIGWFNPE